jgi:hypothetical protein
MIEVRKNADGTLDEIVAKDASVHLEQMDDEVWWLSVISGDREVRVFLQSARPIKATIEGPTP